MQLPDFSAAKVLVVGDLMLDRYWHGPTSRISPEAPVPVVHVNQIEERAGGAGNVALNISSLQAKSILLGYSGNDEAADALQTLLSQAGVHCTLERLEHFPTITKLRVMSRHQQLIRLDFEEGFHDLDQKVLHRKFEKEIGNADVVVLSDYGKGTLTSVDHFIRCAKELDKPILVDPKGTDFERYRNASLITPNLNEFEAVVGPCSDHQAIVEKGQNLIQHLNLEALLVTRGEHGMTLLNNDGQALHLPTHAREVFDVTGAGDTVISVLAAGLAAGMSMDDATRLANVGAGIVVGKLGTATISVEEFRYVLSGQRALHQGVMEINDLLDAFKEARLQGEKIVATNGCFDILHPGHVNYLQQARALGDRLVVLVNSDASVQRLKGPERPINNLQHRMQMLSALECVDWVVPFESDTPRDLLCRLLPDILVKGGDYKDITEIAGHDCVLKHGGEVKILSFIEGHSTTAIIETIKGN